MRRRVFIAAQVLFAAAVVWYAVAALRGQWDAAASRVATIEPRWSWLLAATLIVVATYAVLIQMWRGVVTSSGERLSFGDASRIWFVSNLGKYIPGKIWSIGAMAAMARQEGVSGMVATGSSVLVQLVSIATGTGVVLVAGAQVIDQPVIALGLAIAVAIGIAALPYLLQPMSRAIARITGRNVQLPAISGRTILLTAGLSAMSWIAYGIAFHAFVMGVLGEASGATVSYIAVYAASYIIGFLALFAPGGAVVRESAMIAGMLRLGLSGEGEAVAVALTSRIWLTVTELLPGLVYLVRGKSNREAEQSS